ncbi:ras and ef-hand domain-containing protein [Anaeramoeba ignava]|uniref:Ras and ef-hand domain-containing protein n=1 Tax=Anaeramoeba ignava TaxID=1746090 RepID=A0A9Q0LN70_ANAIG|nr:ras and ef-hand domain-containing protein [Anaeramoeba ignava]
MSEIDPSTLIIKIVLVGDSLVGKTCILKQFCDHEFDPELGATIGVDFRFHTIQIQNKQIQLQIWDTAGQEVFRSITHNYYRNADAVMVVFDITNENSFKGLDEWFKNISEKAPKYAKKMLMANKKDLISQRFLSEDEAKKFAKNFDCLYCEVSAKTGENIYEAFQTLTSETLKDYVLQKQKNQTVTVQSAKSPKTKKSTSQGCC